MACQSSPTHQIRDLIQPIVLTAGVADTLLMRDLFYAEDDALEFLSHENLDVYYSQDAGTLSLKSSEDFEGFTLLEFKLENRTYALPIYSNQKQKFIFRYRPERKPQTRMNIMGTFNDWNRNGLPMHDQDGDGEYEIQLALDPGQYLYQFVVDQRELWDPKNPVKVDNGFGSYNSVVSITGRHSDKAFLHILDFEADETKVTLRLQYERDNQPASLQLSDVIGLLNNQRIPADRLGLKGNQVSLSLAPEQLVGESTVRMVIRQGGQNTNMRTIRFKDGRPIGQNETFNTWHDAIIYAVMIDRFLDGDESNSKPIVHDSLLTKANYLGGDLQGVLQKIEEGYFDSLGVNALWLSPVNDNPNEAYREWPAPKRYFSGYHGYWPTHEKKVEEHFGSLDLLKKLIEQAHEHGLKVLLDFTANHVHQDHAFFKNHPDWFGQLDLPDGRKNIRFWDEYRLTTWFDTFLPSFDYEGSDEALEAMTDNAIWWLKETGADGFRHDAVKHIPNRFWRRLTEKIKREIEIPQDKRVYQIGETFGSYELISSYVNSGQLSSQFNFNLYDTALYVFLNQDVSFDLLAKELDKTFSVYGVNNLMGNVMDSHDKVRFMAYADGDLPLNSSAAVEIGWTNPPQVESPESYDKAKLYLAYLMTIPGVPIVYYGDEIGMTGAADPDNRRMMRFAQQLVQEERTMLDDVRSIIRLRRDHSALRHGDFQTLIANENVFAYLRSDVYERVLVVLNKSGSAQTLEISFPDFYSLTTAIDLTSGVEVLIKEHRLAVTLAALGWKVFVVK